MSRAGTITAVLAVILGLNIATTTSAPAAGIWVVNGTTLTGSAALAKTAATTENDKLIATGVNIECTGNLNSVGLDIKAANKIEASSLILTGCKAATGSCAISGAEIGTVPVTGEVRPNESLEDQATLAPKTKTTLATIKFEGAECALEGVQALNGQAVVRMPTGVTESTLQEIKVNPAESELKLGSSAATLLGAAKLKLATGQGFKVPPGIVILPKTYKFKAVGEAKVFSIYNILPAIEGVKRGEFVPSKEEKNFKVEAGSGCYEEKFYAADPNKEKPCNVTIKALVGKKVEKFELVPVLEPVEFATLSSP